MIRLAKIYLKSVVLVFLLIKTTHFTIENTNFAFHGISVFFSCSDCENYPDHDIDLEVDELEFVSYNIVNVAAKMVFFLEAKALLEKKNLNNRYIDFSTPPPEII